MKPLSGHSYLNFSSIEYFINKLTYFKTVTTELVFNFLQNYNIGNSGL